MTAELTISSFFSHSPSPSLHLDHTMRGLVNRPIIRPTRFPHPFYSKMPDHRGPPPGNTTHQPYPRSHPAYSHSYQSHAPHPPQPPQPHPMHHPHSTARHVSNGTQPIVAGGPPPLAAGPPESAMSNGHGHSHPAPAPMMSANARAAKEKMDALLAQLATANENTWMLVGE
jgi:glucose repression mediator protein